MWYRSASTLGLPGDATSACDFARPPRYGVAAGVRAVAAVLAGGRPPVREREGVSVSGSNLGDAGFPLSGTLSGDA